MDSQLSQSVIKFECKDYVQPVDIVSTNQSVHLNTLNATSIDHVPLPYFTSCVLPFKKLGVQLRSSRYVDRRPLLSKKLLMTS